MEPRNYESGAAAEAPTAPVLPSNGYPTEGNPQTAVPATKPGAFWFYKIGEELRKVIVDAGLTPGDGNLSQLKTAIVNLVKSTNATETVKGTAEIATQAETDAGADNTRIVTPKKLRWGFSVSLTTDGYIVFPSWLGGLIIQWMRPYNSADQEAYNWPMIYPNQVLLTLTTDYGSGLTHTLRVDSQSQSTVTISSDPVSAGQINILGIGY